MKKSYLQLRNILVLVFAVLAFCISSSFINIQHVTDPVFTKKDFKSLRWLEGTWKGTGEGEAPFYEKLEQVNDTLIQITYFSDSTLSQGSVQGGVYLSGGKIYHNYKSMVWELKDFTGKSAAFVPVQRASNKFNWVYVSPEEWTATMYNAGDTKGKLYKMQRYKK